jgi:hypothetical protein
MESNFDSMRNPQTLYRDLRRAEYPPIEEQLDAIWKGGSALELMKLQITNIKQKYPKSATSTPGDPQ